MILHVATTAPVAVRVLADALLGLHIGGAVTGLAAGCVAMIARKGERLHRLAGLTFVFAMLTMSGVGAVVAPMIDDVGSAFGGSIAFYLVLTGWMAGRTRQVKGGPFLIAGVALLAAAIVTLLSLGAVAMLSPQRTLGGEPYGVFFIVAAIATLMAVLDLKVILGEALIGPSRLTRHIWRMGLGLLIALLSGLAQPKAGGMLFHGPTVNLQWIPVGLLLVAIAYWLIRVRHDPLNRPHTSGGAGLVNRNTNPTFQAMS